MSDQNVSQFIHGQMISGARPVSVQDIAAFIDKGRILQRSRPLPTQEQILSFFDRLNKTWSDHGSIHRKKAAALLEKNNGFNPVFVKMLLEKFPMIFAPERISRQVEGEFGDIQAMDKLVFQKSINARLLVRPAGSVLHVVAGNVFLSAVESLVHGIITKNMNYFKMPSGDTHFPMIFAQSMKECDIENIICQRISLLSWPGGDHAIEDLFKQAMDRIVFWGGYDGLMSWKKDLGPETILVQHGPKVSFGMISKNGLEAVKLDDLTDRMAFDISIWEQKACNCPQVIYLEDSVSPDKRKELIGALAESLKRACAEMPPAERSDDDHVEVLRARELAFAKDALTLARVSIIGPSNLDWTIIYEEQSEQQDLDLSPLNRTILVKHYSDIRSLAESIREKAFYLQTVGYCLTEKEAADYAMILSNLGVTRLCPFGAMSFVKPGAPHDGTYSLRDLTRTTVIE